MGILENFHKKIQNKCHESPRNCWEYMLEMIAHASGWRTETSYSKHLWDHFPDGDDIASFIECWVDEVKEAKASGTPFSEPIGELLEKVESTNPHLGQFFTPMSVVHMMVQMQLHDTPKRSGWLNGVDPCCGTGRFLLSSLVHTDNLMMGAVDLDLWLLRAAMLNTRLLAGFTSRFYQEKDSQMQPFTEESTSRLKKRGVSLPEKPGGVYVLGGRARFIHGDALRVDLTYPFNWDEHSWCWSPFDWSQLKMSSETEEEYRERVINPLLKKIGGDPGVITKNARFDYSMTNKTRVAG